jgi:amino acid transporter
LEGSPLATLPPEKNNAPGQSHQLGLSSLVAIVVANMIGVGVFTSSGFSIAALGNPGRVMLAWILCGLWALCGAIAYGGLISRIPQSGGEYLFLSRLVHPSIGFLAGWISLIAGFTAPIALAAKSAAVHLAPEVWMAQANSSDWKISLLASALIVTALAIHLAGLKIGVGTQNAVVVCKLGLLLWIVIVAYWFTSTSQWQGAALPGRNPAWLPETPGAWWALAGSMSWLALSYTGFNATIYVAQDTCDAKRLVPLSMILGTVLVTAIYLALNYIFVYFPEPSLLLGAQGFGEEKVATVVGLALGGPSLAEIVRLVVILSTVSSVFAMLLLGPRVYQQMALDGVFPAIFRDHSYRKTLLLQAALSVTACFSGSILDMMAYLGLTLSACGAIAVASLYWVERRLPEARSLNWREHSCVAIYLSITVLIIAASYETRPTQFWAMLYTIGLGLALYLVMEWRRRFTKRGQSRTDSAR